MLTSPSWSQVLLSLAKATPASSPRCVRWACNVKDCKVSTGQAQFREALAVVAARLAVRHQLPRQPPPQGAHGETGGLRAARRGEQPLHLPSTHFMGHACPVQLHRHALACPASFIFIIQTYYSHQKNFSIESFRLKRFHTPINPRRRGRGMCLNYPSC